MLENRSLSETGYELVLERGDLAFRAGELVSLYGAGRLDCRDYTIASGEGDSTLRVLYRLVPEGVLTPQLRALNPGDSIDLSGPYGTFVLREIDRPVVFIATGTGIAPAVAYARTFPKLDLTIVHGSSREEDLFYREAFSGYSYYPCVSSVPVEGFCGRVTRRLERLELDENAHYYLCGANEMIYEVQDLLADRQVPAAHVFTEPYYYRRDD